MDLCWLCAHLKTRVSSCYFCTYGVLTHCCRRIWRSLTVNLYCNLYHLGFVFDCYFLRWEELTTHFVPRLKQINSAPSSLGTLGDTESLSHPEWALPTKPTVVIVRLPMFHVQVWGDFSPQCRRNLPTGVEIWQQLDVVASNLGNLWQGKTNLEA